MLHCLGVDSVRDLQYCGAGAGEDEEDDGPIAHAIAGELCVEGALPLSSSRGGMLGDWFLLHGAHPEEIGRVRVDFASQLGLQLGHRIGGHVCVDRDGEAVVESVRRSIEEVKLEDGVKLDLVHEDVVGHQSLGQLEVRRRTAVGASLLVRWPDAR